MLLEIDGVVCKYVDQDRPDLMATAEPFSDARERIKRWHKEGCYICFFTARSEQLKIQGFRG